MKPIILTVTFILLAATSLAYAQTADDLLSRGIAKNQAGDVAGAIADFSQAIEMDPKNVAAYVERGLARRNRKEFEGAITDHSRVIELVPNFATAYVLRSIDERHKGDFEAAILDASHAIALQPDDPDAYANRACAKRFNGEFDGALADATMSISLAPKNANAYQVRGHIRYDKHEWADALADFRKEEIFSPGSDYARIHVWLTQTRMGDKDVAIQELQNYLKARKGNPNDWSVTVGRFLVGQITEADFLLAADHIDKIKNTQQHCEAYYYAGNMRSLTGDNAGARDFFQKCVATGEINYTESLVSG